MWCDAPIEKPKPKSPICTYCNKLFTDDQHLNRHIKLYHVGSNLSDWQIDRGELMEHCLSDEGISFSSMVVTGTHQKTRRTPNNVTTRQKQFDWKRDKREEGGKEKIGIDKLGKEF